MKTILCYGDSNTYGYVPGTGTRYPKGERWTDILQSLLPADFEVIAEGLNGRTTAYDREGDDIKNGLRHMVPILHSHRPLHIVIFMLGTNDCNAELNITVKDIRDGMEKLIVKAKEAIPLKQSDPFRIIVVAPPHISPSYKGGPFHGQLNDGSVSKSRALSKEYEELCEKHGCVFVDARDIKVSDTDGLHLTSEAHDKLGHLIARTVLSLKD